ncbi:hypothetical protein [Acidisphaera rubrifaciens]|uniref:N-acetyltransferase domain-containing protein n=1 Tax=Acidisphaera rubrifaciens HS-AP3 TaxID=1231350 RepID=A0A0D6P4S1_9PROT|nr:hypothetical protein [Acidisphaera rubrifaciens]GAN76341.1 hypothetical protein Asru_0086_17 [Acidisphaera rubrifaciens HS-AP3]
MLSTQSRLRPFAGERARVQLEHVAGSAIGNALDWEARLGSAMRPGMRDALRASQHVTFATEDGTGRVLGLVAATSRSTTNEPFLLLDHVLVGSDRAGHRLLRRLVALLVLRVAGREGVPHAIAAALPEATIATSLRDLSAAFTESAAYPQGMDATVSLATVRLATRIAHEIAPSRSYDLARSMLRSGGRDATTASPVGFAEWHDDCLVVLDLRGADETVIIDDARAAYRRR